MAEEHVDREYTVNSQVWPTPAALAGVGSSKCIPRRNHVEARETMDPVTGAIIQSCWVEVFPLSQFRGARRRLYGPGAWDGLRSRLPDWGLQIDSLVVGPRAYVQLYRRDELEKTCVWFLPNERIADLLHHVTDDHDSLRLSDRPPDPTDAGYAAYVRASSRLGAAPPPPP